MEQSAAPLLVAAQNSDKAALQSTGRQLSMPELREAVQPYRAQNGLGATYLEDIPEQPASH